MHVGSLVWVSRLAGGEFGAFSRRRPAGVGEGRERKDLGGEDDEVQGVKCKVSDSVE